MPVSSYFKWLAASVLLLTPTLAQTINSTITVDDNTVGKFSKKRIDAWPCAEFDEAPQEFANYCR